MTSPVVLQKRLHGLQDTVLSSGAAPWFNDYVFPLSISGRHLVDSNGKPFFINFGTAWSLEVQCNQKQIRQYLWNRAHYGFNALMFEAFEHLFSQQGPNYWVNRYGEAPFTTMTRFDLPNSAYWDTIDYIVAQAAALKMVCFIFPCYYGYQGTEEGWDTELIADTQAHRIAYGEFLMNRYGDAGNIIWVLGGDNPNGASYDADIVTGMRNIRTDQILTGHSSRSNDAYSKYSAQVGFNLNTTYVDDTAVDDAITAYGRAGPLPFFLIEGRYEETSGSDAKTYRNQVYSTLLSGGAGVFFANAYLWGFGANNSGFFGAWSDLGPDSLLENKLNTTGVAVHAHLRSFVDAIPWTTLVPVKDASFVTSSLGTGADTVSPALVADGSFGAIYTPTYTNVTVDLSNFSSRVRIRFFDPTTGEWSIEGEHANTGTYPINTPGIHGDGFSDWIIVLEAV